MEIMTTLSEQLNVLLVQAQETENKTTQALSEAADKIDHVFTARSQRMFEAMNELEAARADLDNAARRYAAAAAFINTIEAETNTALAGMAGELRVVKLAHMSTSARFAPAMQPPSSGMFEAHTVPEIERPRYPFPRD